eukprot:g68920.t1
MQYYASVFNGDMQRYQSYLANGAAPLPSYPPGVTMYYTASGAPSQSSIRLSRETSLSERQPGEGMIPALSRTRDQRAQNYNNST